MRKSRPKVSLLLGMLCLTGKYLLMSFISEKYLFNLVSLIGDLFGTQILLFTCLSNLHQHFPTNKGFVTSVVLSAASLSGSLINYYSI